MEGTPGKGVLSYVQLRRPLKWVDPLPLILSMTMSGTAQRPQPRLAGGMGATVRHRWRTGRQKQGLGSSRPVDMGGRELEGAQPLLEKSPESCCPPTHRGPTSQPL